jgi:hypothetical protein
MLKQIVFCSNGIMPDHPQPDFDFEWNFAFSEMSERRVPPIPAQMLVN